MPLNFKENTKLSKKNTETKYNSKKCLDLSYASKFYSNRLKNHHIEIMIKKHKFSLENDKDHPNFLYLIFQIRSYCISLAYFPFENKYKEIFKNYHDHPGWYDEMKDNEREILELFNNAALNIIKNCKDTKLFNIVEEKFVTYRHQRWLDSL
jgi:hypothetical protein